MHSDGRHGACVALGSNDPRAVSATLSFSGSLKVLSHSEALRHAQVIPRPTRRGYGQAQGRSEGRRGLRLHQPASHDLQAALLGRERPAGFGKTIEARSLPVPEMGAWVRES